jgi:hypothetical protein
VLLRFNYVAGPYRKRESQRDVSGYKTSRMSLRWWQNSKRWETIQRSSMRSPVAALEKKSPSTGVYPLALLIETQT